MLTFLHLTVIDILLPLVWQVVKYSTVIVHARWSNDSKTALLIASAYINSCPASVTLI
jgi:hypothetical protein